MFITTYVSLYLLSLRILLNKNFQAILSFFFSGGTPVVADSSKSVTVVTTASPVVDKPSSTPVVTSTPKTTTVALNSPQPVVKLVKLSTSTNMTASCDITNNQEQIVEKAKQVIVKRLFAIIYSLLSHSNECKTHWHFIRVSHNERCNNFFDVTNKLSIEKVQMVVDIFYHYFFLLMVHYIYL